MRNRIKKLFIESKLTEIVTYHGTSQAFDQPSPDKIFWTTTNPDLAKEYSQGDFVHRKGKEPIVYSYDIQANHPAIVSGEYISIIRLLTDWIMNAPNKNIPKETIIEKRNEIIDKWHQIGLDNSQTAVYNHWNISGSEGNLLLIRFLELLGYDSIYYKENGADTYGVWKNIKNLR